MPPNTNRRRPESELELTVSRATWTEIGSSLALSLTIVMPSGVRQVSMRVGPKL